MLENMTKQFSDAYNSVKNYFKLKIKKNDYNLDIIEKMNLKKLDPVKGIDGICSHGIYDYISLIGHYYKHPLKTYTGFNYWLNRIKK